jgi:hypothetical protein
MLTEKMKGWTPTESTFLATNYAGHNRVLAHKGKKTE